jgi:Flp pilus assembly pilin Flp
MRNRRGVTSLEYAIIAAIIVATLTGGFTFFASDLSSKFSVLAGSL